MNTILVQHSNAKFIQSTIFSSIENANIVSSHIKNNLYQIYYSIKPTHAIFDSNMLTHEIMQFIQDFSNNLKCFVYHETLLQEVVDLFKGCKVTHLSYSSEYPNGICLPRNLINTKIFYLNSTIKKQDSLVCFLDGLPILPDFFKDYLYPKDTLPIKLFNNPYIQHHQNLGILTETDKAAVLQNHKYYIILNNNDKYIEEAKHCGCIIVNIENIKHYTSLSYSQPSQYTDFSIFFQENIL